MAIDLSGDLRVFPSVPSTRSASLRGAHSASALVLALLACWCWGGAFDVLTGASQLLSYSLCAVIPAALLSGLYLAMRLRKVSPQRFMALGSHKL